MIGPRAYVLVDRDALEVRDAKRGVGLRQPPLAALAGTPRRIVAIGDEALRMRGRAETIVVNPFDHPRTPLSDFTVAEELVKAFLKKVGIGGFLGIDLLVIALTHRPEGGLTQIEIRALKELGVGAGAREVVVWEGPRLSDEQVARRSFPTTGEVLA